MTRRINPLNPLFRVAEKLAQREEIAQGKEAALVSWTMKRLGLQSAIKRLTESSGLLTFAAFNCEFDFPVDLFWLDQSDALPLHRDSKSVHPVWFKSFPKLPVVKNFLALYDVRQSKKPMAMIFPRKGLARGLVIHNAGVERFTSPGVGYHACSGFGKKDMTLVVQSYASLVDYAHDCLSWAPV